MRLGRLAAPPYLASYVRYETKGWPARPIDLLKIPGVHEANKVS